MSLQTDIAGFLNRGINVDTEGNVTRGNPYKFLNDQKAKAANLDHGGFPYEPPPVLPKEPPWQPPQIVVIPPRIDPVLQLPDTTLPSYGPLEPALRASEPSLPPDPVKELAISMEAYDHTWDAPEEKSRYQEEVSAEPQVSYGASDDTWEAAEKSEVKKRRKKNKRTAKRKAPVGKAQKRKAPVGKAQKRKAPVGKAQKRKTKKRVVKKRKAAKRAS